MKKDQLYFGFLLIGLIGLGAYFMFAKPAPEIAYKPVEIEGSSLTAQNQPFELVVGLNATVVEAGYISIHPSLSGAPRAPIGHSELLEPGEYTDLIIQLDEPMLPGFRYIAMMTVDDGNGFFEAGVDLPVAVDGQTVRQDFLYTPEGEEE